MLLTELKRKAIDQDKKYDYILKEFMRIQEEEAGLGLTNVIYYLSEMVPYREPEKLYQEINKIKNHIIYEEFKKKICVIATSTINVDFGNFVAVMQIFTKLKDPSLLPVLIDLKNKMNLVLERKEYNWATEYCPPSPLRTIEQAITRSQGVEFNINEWNKHMEKVQAELNSK